MAENFQEQHTLADMYKKMTIYGDMTLKGIVNLRTMQVGNIGHHIASISPADGHCHLHTTSSFDGEATLEDVHVLYAYDFTERKVLQADDSGLYTGTDWESQFYAATSVLSKKRYFKTGPTVPTTPVTQRIYKGVNANGPLVLEQTYAPSVFVASSEIELPLDGYFESEAGSMYYTTITCMTPFSIKTNAAVTAPWVAADDVDVREDNLLQTRRWVSGESWDDGDLFIDSRQIYVCNTTGVQSGTFAGNSDKWDLFTDKYVQGLFTPTAVPYADADGRLTENPTDLFYDSYGYLHTPGLAIPGEEPIHKIRHGLSLTSQNEEDFTIVHLNTLTVSHSLKYITAKDNFLFDVPIEVNGLIETAGGDSDDWNMAYGWGDHSVEGYLTEETDPVFTAWDKETGIVISESQISDLDHFETGDETDPIFIAWDKSTGISITESQISDLDHFVTGDETDPIYVAWYNNGVVEIPVSVETPKIFRDGTLHLQGNVNGNVELFDLSDVANNENSGYFYLNRKAPEGNDYIRMFISSGRTGYIHGSPPNGLYLQGQTDMGLYAVTGDVILRLGDNAGVKKVRFKDSSNNVVGYMDSNGNFQCDGFIGINKAPTTYTLEMRNDDPIILFENSRSIVGIGYNIGALLFNGGEAGPNDVGVIRIDASEDWTDTSSPTKMTFSITPSGAVHAGTGKILVIDENGIDVDGPVRVGRMTTAQRDALPADNGMIIYNTTTAFFEFYQDGSWINMEDSK